MEFKEPLRPLSILFQDFPYRVYTPFEDLAFRRIVSDSRKVQPGDLFIALQGDQVDGHQFIPQAVEQGASAVVGMQPDIKPSVSYIRVEDTRKALPYLAAAYYGHPARKLTMVGITGTDGKTTTANLIYSILQAAGFRAGMISTVNALIGEAVLDTGFHVTTPDPLDVQHYLAWMVEAGLTHAVLETTSHGWAQYRVDACEFDVGVVTNITHEHLDYHGSYENYRDAKARLISSLAETHLKPQGNPRLAVINRDDQSFDFLWKLCSSLGGIRCLSYSLFPRADVVASQVHSSLHGLSFKVSNKDYQLQVNSRLVGNYNISNCLAAIAATVEGLGVSPETARIGIENFTGVPGRMELIDLGQDFTAIVDFAHTPNALQKALETARQITGGKLIAVFGSAGLRDQAKRKMMAEISAQLADYTILTAEDPRTESLEAILEQMASGAKEKGGIEGKTFWRIPDRGEAIRYAVRKLARPGDLVIACGKGHEQSMCFGETEYPWDDRQAMRAALAERLGLPIPVMPYLPTHHTMA